MKEDASEAYANVSVHNLSARLARVHDALERLVAAVRWEVPPIRDGVEVERRLDILLACADEAAEALSDGGSRASPTKGKTS